MNPSTKPAPRWLLPDLKAQPSGLSIAERVLWTRGYRDPDTAARFLGPRIADLHQPALLRDMAAAAARVARAIRDSERILLYGDYDVDGTTSVVILKRAIQIAGGQAEFYVPHRMRDGYGMRPEVIDRAAEAGVRLVISVDTGIRAGAVVQHARELGIDVIVTDHHLPEAELPPAVAVVNPNRRDCTYPDKNLCGAAVTLKLVQATLEAVGWAPAKVARITESFLKMVALATVADVVPLIGENRIIVKCGLDGFTSVRNPGLRALLRVSGFKDGDCPTAGQVAFRIAPRINAAGRMDHAAQVIELFLTDDPDKAAAIAAQLHELNKERQETEAEIVRCIEEVCVQLPVTDHDAALVFSGKDWHKGVVGIVASRIVERYGRPTFVLSEDEASGFASGSGRSIRAFHLLDALESMHELFTKFGGHRQAAGVTMPLEAVPLFRDKLNEWAAARLTPEDFRPTLEIDAVLGLDELNGSAVADIERLAPFGFGNPAPLFAVMDVEIAGASLKYDRLVNVGLRQNGRCVFVSGWDWAHRMEEFRPGRRVNVALCLEDRNRNGEWRATLKDVQGEITRSVHS